MLPQSLFRFIDGSVEGLRLEVSFSAFAYVVAEFPGKAFGAFYAANRAVLIAFAGGIKHCTPSSVFQRRISKWCTVVFY
jgi:hypothetical protein